MDLYEAPLDVSSDKLKDNIDFMVKHFKNDEDEDGGKDVTKKSNDTKVEKSLTELLETTIVEKVSQVEQKNKESFNYLLNSNDQVDEIPEKKSAEETKKNDGYKETEESIEEFLKKTEKSLKEVGRKSSENILKDILQKKTNINESSPQEDTPKEDTKKGIKDLLMKTEDSLLEILKKYDNPDESLKDDTKFSKIDSLLKKPDTPQGHKKKGNMEGLKKENEYLKLKLGQFGSEMSVSNTEVSSKKEEMTIENLLWENERLKQKLRQLDTKRITDDKGRVESPVKENDMIEELIKENENLKQKLKQSETIPTTIHTHQPVILTTQRPLPVKQSGLREYSSDSDVKIIYNPNTKKTKFQNWTAKVAKILSNKKLFQNQNFTEKIRDKVHYPIPFNQKAEDGGKNEVVKSGIKNFFNHLFPGKQHFGRRLKLVPDSNEALATKKPRFKLSSKKSIHPGHYYSCYQCMNCFTVEESTSKCSTTEGCLIEIGKKKNAERFVYRTCYDDTVDGVAAIDICKHRKDSMCDVCHSHLCNYNILRENNLGNGEQGNLTNIETIYKSGVDPSKETTENVEISSEEIRTVRSLALARKASIVFFLYFVYLWVYSKIY